MQPPVGAAGFCACFRPFFLFVFSVFSSVANFFSFGSGSAFGGPYGELIALFDLSTSYAVASGEDRVKFAQSSRLQVSRQVAVLSAKSNIALQRLEICLVEQSEKPRQDPPERCRTRTQTRFRIRTRRHIPRNPQPQSRTGTGGYAGVNQNDSTAKGCHTQFRSYPNPLLRLRGAVRSAAHKRQPVICCWFSYCPTALVDR